MKDFQPQKETQGREEGEHKDEWIKSHYVWIVGRRLALIFHKIAQQYLCRTFAALNFHVAEEIDLCFLFNGANQAMLDYNR